MNRSLPPLGWFRAFESAARLLSFTAAARELGMTQSAVSQHIRSLEARLGSPLFVRLPRSIALTDEGRRLLPEITAAMAQLADATRSFDVEHPESFLTVAMSVSFAQWFIAPNLAGFQTAHPDVHIRFMNTVWADNHAGLSADIEIRFGSDEHVGRNAMRLGPDSLIAVAAPQLHQTGKDLQQAPLIAVSGLSSNWQDWSKTHDASMSREPSCFVDSHGMALDLAAHGCGIALTSSLLAQPCLDDGRLIKVHDGELSVREGYYLAIKDETHAPTRAFTEWLDSLRQATSQA